jgi:cytoskeleton protein RodZ
MFAIGDSLREARTRRGLSAADVQKGIRIRERYLTALEEERWELLPGEAYTKGFLRTYAEFLGLDGNLYIDEFNTRLVHREEEPPLVPQSLVAAHRTRRGVLRTLLTLLVVVGAISAVAAWGMTGRSPSSRDALGSAPAGAPVVSHAAKATPTASTAPAAHPTTTAALATTTVIRASRGRCWLSIRTGGATGPVVYEGVLPQGKALHFSLLHQTLWVRMGRPASLDISLGGQPVAGLPANPANVLLTRSGARSA